MSGVPTSMRKRPKEVKDTMDEWLAHYGILGMKWGVRRYQPYSVRGRKSGEGGKEVGEAKKKSKTPTKEQLLKSTDPNEVWKYRDQLNDRELRERVNRIQTEQQLQQIIAQSSKKGETAANKVLKKVETMAIAGIAAYAFKNLKVLANNPTATIEAVKKGMEVAKDTWMNYPWGS